tara:strand:+ start:313 stop:483 length:171 start_codon:yes stop_codon:yes gene_type:complete
MKKIEFDDTQTSGIWWSTYVGIKDLCIDLQDETKCRESEIISFLREIANSIELDGF